MKMRWLGIAFLFAVVLGATFGPPTAQAQETGFAVPVTGELQSFGGEPGSFEGTLTITSFELQDSLLMVNGAIEGELFDAQKSPIGNVRRVLISLNVTDIQGSCADLLLQLDLFVTEESADPISLDPLIIDASRLSGSDKQLANLLCAVGHLLDNNSPPPAMAALLARINAILRSFG